MRIDTNKIMNTKTMKTRMICCLLMAVTLLGIVSCKTKGGSTQQDGAYTYAATEDTSSAQNDTLSAVEISLSQLQGTKWAVTSPINDDEESTWEFTSSQVIEKTYYKNSNDRYDSTFPYYLYDSRPFPFYDESLNQVEFRKTLVGKSPKGRYIIMYNDKMDYINWYIIKSYSLENGEMCLFRENRGELGVGYVTIHFKLISKGSHGEGRR